VNWRVRAENRRRDHAWNISNFRGVFCSACFLVCEREWIEQHAPLCPKASEPVCPCLGDYCTRPDCDW
jgi:hypothetical protein